MNEKNIPMKQTQTTDACSNMDEPQSHFATCQILCSRLHSMGFHLLETEKASRDWQHTGRRDTFQVLEVFLKICV